MAQSPSSLKPEESRLLEWLRSQGAEFSKMQWPWYNPDGVRGCAAAEDIAPNEAIVCIPRKLLITPLTCYEGDLADVYEDAADAFGGDDDLIMTLFLMHERLKGERSFWAPFLHLHFSDELLSDWEEHELRELQDDALASEAPLRLEAIERAYLQVIGTLNGMYPERFDDATYSFSLFKWAFIIVSSRGFGRTLPWPALAPLADMVNHAHVDVKYDFDVDDNGLFRLVNGPNAPIRKGEEVFLCYGERRVNCAFLLDYGFAMLDNCWERIAVKVELEEGLDRVEERQALLARCKIDLHKPFLLRWGQPCEALLAYHRIMSLQGADWNAAKGLRRVAYRPVSVSNERRAMARMVAQLRGMLDAYPTTIQQDEQLVNDLRAGASSVERPHRLFAALAYRLTRKRLLQRHLRWMSAEQAVADVVAAQLEMRQVFPAHQLQSRLQQLLHLGNHEVVASLATHEALPRVQATSTVLPDMLSDEDEEAGGESEEEASADEDATGGEGAEEAEAGGMTDSASGYEEDDEEGVIGAPTDAEFAAERQAANDARET